MMHNIAVIVCFLFCTLSVYSSEYKVTFTYYMMTNPASVNQVDLMTQNSSYNFSDEDVRFIEKCSVFRDEYSIVTSNGIVNIDTLRPVSYAKKVDEKYELVPSDKNEGFCCNLEVANEQDDVLVLKGAWQYYSLCERERFEPFPQIEAGQPKIVLEARNKNLMLRKGLSRIESYGLARTKRSGTSLVVLLARYETIDEN